MRLSHILPNLYAEWTSLLTRSALHTLPRMMFQHPVMIPHSLRDIRIPSGLRKIEEFRYGRNIYLNGAGLAV